MNFIFQVLLGMVAMAIVDLPMIKYAIDPTLRKSAPHLITKKPNKIAALIFYIGYVALVVYLTQLNSQSTSDVAVKGALLGLLAYGTYEFTNKAVIKDWPWRMVLIDTSWGVVLTTAVALTANLVA